ncbi:MAG: TerB family tellurite resistance protein [Bacteroidetes bacterium]|nr:TerB family tellurite resistance protein [Bacteroidota bacterium]
MLAIIIFGTRGVRSTVSEGTFVCPQCISNQQYKHKKVTQFFTLYFIPLIPMGNKGEYVECLGCRNTYITRILQMQPTLDITEKQATSAAVGQPRAQLNTGAVDSTAAIEPEKDKVIKKLLIMMILADGKVENAEIVSFHRIYHESTGQTVRDIYKEMDEVKAENKSPHQYLKEVVHGLNQEGKEAILKASMRIAAADGDIDPSEVRMVENFGKALELKPAEVAAIIEEAKNKQE